VAGAGQKAATEAVRARAAQKASDLAPEIRKAGAGSLREIAKALTERGIPQPSGGMGAWSAVQVSRTMARLRALGGCRDVFISVSQSVFLRTLQATISGH
jgi:hypothetical protein